MLWFHHNLVGPHHQDTYDPKYRGLVCHARPQSLSEKVPPHPLQRGVFKRTLFCEFLVVAISIRDWLKFSSRVMYYLQIMGRGRSSATKEKIENSKKVSEEEIKEVFDFWVLTFKKRVTALDEKRRIAIGNAIHLYGIENCKDAIRGCTYSDFHMGRNSAKKVYNEIELILRDAEHVERFIDFLPGGNSTVVEDNGSDPF